MLESLSKDALKKIAELMALKPGLDAETWHLVLAIAGGRDLAKRATEWLPEAFGHILISRIPGVVLPTTFHVKDAQGLWYELPFTAEPLTKRAFELGAETIKSGSMDMFEKIALRSSIVAAVNTALNSGTNSAGAKISGPAFVKLSAEMYVKPKAE